MTRKSVTPRKAWKHAYDENVSFDWSTTITLKSLRRNRNYQIQADRGFTSCLPSFRNTTKVETVGSRISELSILAPTNLRHVKRSKKPYLCFSTLSRRNFGIHSSIFGSREDGAKTFLYSTSFLTRHEQHRSLLHVVVAEDCKNRSPRRIISKISCLPSIMSSSRRVRVSSNIVCYVFSFFRSPSSSSLFADASSANASFFPEQ